MINSLTARSKVQINNIIGYFIIINPFTARYKVPINTIMGPFIIINSLTARSKVPINTIMGPFIIINSLTARSKVPINTIMGPFIIINSLTARSKVPINTIMGSFMYFLERRLTPSGHVALKNQTSKFGSLSYILFTQSKIIQIAIWIKKFCPMQTLDLDHDLDNFNPDIRWIEM